MVAVVVVVVGGVVVGGDIVVENMCDVVAVFGIVHGAGVVCGYRLCLLLHCHLPIVSVYVCC